MTHVDLNPQAALVLAINISIAGIEMALASYGGAIIAREAATLNTYEAEAQSFGQLVAAEIKSFLARQKVSASGVLRIGIAVQGAADSQSGTIMWSPAFRGRNLALVKPIEEALGIPTHLANDANMMAEALDAEAHGTTAVVFMGYGVGMGLILDGKVYHGPTGAAAEFGHMNHIPDGALCRCGRRGCIEAYAADYAVLRGADGTPGDLPAFSGIASETMRGLEVRARSGEAKARAAYAKAGEALGYGLARLCALLSPSRIVIAGPGAAAMDLIEPHLRSAFAKAVVEELRRNTVIEAEHIDTGMIIKGTLASILRALDADVFAAGPLQATVKLEKTA